MGAYVFFFIVVFIGAIVSYKAQKPVWYFVLSVVLLWLLIGLRDISVGADTRGYVDEFTSIAKLNFSEMWKQTLAYKDPLYILISWSISCISTNYTFYLLIWALFPAVSLYITFKREFKDRSECLISILVFFLLGLFAFYVAGIRQTAAISLVLLSFKSIHEKKLIQFLLYVIVASLLHNSAVIFLIAFPLCFIRFRWWYLFFLIALIYLLSFVALDSVFVYAQFFFGDRFDSYGMGYESTQSNSAFIMQIILFAICVYKAKTLIKKDSTNSTLFFFAFIGICFQSMAGILAEMSRISFYFCVFDLILVPRALEEYGNTKSQNILLTVFSVIAMVYLFFLTSANLPEYRFAF